MSQVDGQRLAEPRRAAQRRHHAERAEPRIEAPTREPPVDGAPVFLDDPVRLVGCEKEVAVPERGGGGHEVGQILRDLAEDGPLPVHEESRIAPPARRVGGGSGGGFPRDEEMRRKRLGVDDVPAFLRVGGHIQRRLRRGDEALGPAREARVLASRSAVRLEARDALVEDPAQGIGGAMEGAALGVVDAHRMEVGHELRRAFQVARLQMVEIERIPLAEALDERPFARCVGRVVQVERTGCPPARLEQRERGELVGDLVVVEGLRSHVYAQDEAPPAAGIVEAEVAVVLAFAQIVGLERGVVGDAERFAKGSVFRKIERCGVIVQRGGARECLCRFMRRHSLRKKTYMDKRNGVLERFSSKVCSK